MDNQMTIFDIEPSLKTPEAWECYKSCANYGKHMSEFSVGGDRCDYGFYMDGSSGNDIIQEVDKDSVVHFYCRYYKKGQ